MATAFLYNDGSFVFSSGDTADSSKTLVASYTGWDTAEYTNSSQVPWYSDGNYTSIVSVSFNSTVSPISTAYWFYICANLTSFDATNLDTSNVTNMNYMFRDCTSLTSLDLSNFDTSNVTNMYSMFYGCSALTSLDLSSFNTSNVTTMGAMFYGCSALTSLDLSNFDTSKVDSMGKMFSQCASLASLDLSNFDTSKVDNMKFMFNQCTSLTSLNVSSFNTSNVTNMEGMFDYCYALTSLDVSNFDTSKVTNMANMFYYCKELTILDISSFDTSNVTDMTSMFSYCYFLSTIYVSDKWSTYSVISSNYMLTDCRRIVGGNGTVYDSTIVDATYARIDTPEKPGYLTYKKYYPNQAREEYLIQGTTWYDIAESVRDLKRNDEKLSPSKVIEVISRIGHAEEVEW